MKLFPLCFFVALFLIQALVVVSQPVPNIQNLQSDYRPEQDLNRTMREIEARRLEAELSKELEQLEQPEPEEPEPEHVDKAPEVSVMVRQIIFNPGSVVLSDDMLSGMVADYLNRQVTLQQLNELVEKINRIYRERGYITAMAVLPPQQVKDGILRIALIEGRVGKVVIENNKSTRESFITERVSIPKGKVVSIKDLDSDLQWFNHTSDLRLQIRLQAGEKPGATDFVITAIEPAKYEFVLFGDTAGSSNTGRNRAGLSYTDRSISGKRNSIALTIMTASTLRTALLNYSWPIDTRGSRLGLAYSVNNLSVSRDDINAFRIDGNSGSIGVNYTRPMVATQRLREEMQFQIQRQSTKNEVLGARFVDDKTVRYRVSRNYLRLSPGELIFFSPEFVYSKYEGLGEKKDTRKITFNCLWQRRLRGKQSISLRLNMQYAPDEYLASSDLYYLGGLYTVRGYSESLLGGDSGINARFDFEFPTDIANSTRFFVFYDWGRIHGKSLLTTRIIHSAGFGINQVLDKVWNVRANVGYPFIKRIGDQDVSPFRIDLSLNKRF